MLSSVYDPLWASRRLRPLQAGFPSFTAKRGTGNQQILEGDIMAFFNFNRFRAFDVRWVWKLNDNFEKLSDHLGFEYKEKTDQQNQINKLFERVTELEELVTPSVSMPRKRKK